MSNKSRGIILTSVRTLVIFLMIVAKQVSSSDEELKGPEREPITFQEFLKNNFTTKSFDGFWDENSNIILKNETKSLVEYNVETGIRRDLLSNETKSLLSDFATFVDFAPNNKNLMLFYDDEDAIWRHSFEANYFVIDTSTNQKFNIEPSEKTESGTKLRFAKWLKGTQNNEIIFVYDNNIYLVKNLKDKSDTIKLTTDGVVDSIYNGVPDWVYEEEILSTNEAMFSSENGKYLAYVQFNDTEVKSFYYTKYGDPKKPLSNQYPNDIKLPYPKVGTVNPTFKIFVKDLTSIDSPALEVQPPLSFLSTHKEYIFFRVYWITNDKLGVIWMNRVQNSGVHSECTRNSVLSTWNCETVLRNEQPSGWLILNDPKYNSDGTGFLQFLPQIQNDGLHYQHLALVNTSTKGESVPVFLTTGKIYVTEIIGWDEKTDRLFFTATAPGNPGVRHLYETRGMNCITCNLHLSDERSLCTYNNIKMSLDFKYYIHICTGPSIGEITVRNVESNQIIKVLQDNSNLKQELNKKRLPEIIRLSVDIPNSQFKAQVKMRLPPGYDSSAVKKYPLIILVYGGPESQKVNDEWALGWADFLATNYDVVYGSIDGRGSGFQSNENIYALNRRFGTVEVEDQIEVTKILLDQFSFLDGSRVGIWGHSYGGYSTLMVLAKDSENVFKCGISVAPVTDWLFYDSIYTERFMGLPTIEDNLDGYTNASILSFVENLRGKDFMINHGVADDNVHFQHSLMLFRALQKADIPFIQNTFPEENHSIGGMKKFQHHTFDSFWTRCFGLKSVITK